MPNNGGFKRAWHRHGRSAWQQAFPSPACGELLHSSSGSMGNFALPLLLAVLLDLYNACVQPPRSYGCDGLAFLQASVYSNRMRLQSSTSHVHMLKLIGGVRKSAEADVLSTNWVRGRLLWKCTVRSWNCPFLELVCIIVAVHGCLFAVA
jgi:hypothetical protein